MRKKLIAVSLISLVAISIIAVSYEGMITESEDIKTAKLDLMSVPPVQEVVIAGSPNQSDHLPFDWAIYTDPSRPEFWDDGADGTLPRPFLYLSAHPTEENARKLVEWQALQWATIEKVIKALGGVGELELYNEYLGEDLIGHLRNNEQTIALASHSPNKGEPLPDLVGRINWQNVQIVQVYASFCPACKKSVDLVEKLKGLGAQVTLLQSDYEENEPLYTDSIPYEGDWREFFPHRQTPTYYIKVGDHAPQRSDGFIDFRSLKNHIHNILGDKNHVQSN